MGAMDGFYRAVYKETVLVWAITLWQTAVVSAIVVPRFYDKNKPEFKENPPSLKEVVAGLQRKIGH
eukprot:CAMPEP_0202351068 /NCGR_PEP_ID=MMETSP1126-20121109/7878_1 /ASSEMBLY_ACC=CAM_ASM_000457 /TAXON_ID=3047 /ORGANISM="Dunaliella tertiolecta, Strain CCMP1320" /LENGTH=65 /DNA_ID=CAMNT_0048943145 /DNA_START=51 /DNA_END=248 /DNA_ORIENTATION=+